MGDSYDVIVAGYQSVEAAQKDFEGLVQLVRDKKVRTEGVILVEHDADGKVVFDLKPHAHADEHDLHQHAAHHAVAAGVAG